jgi:hypothetical protein
MEYKINDFPDLIKRGAGVINTNQSEYHRAKARIQNAKRIDNLEGEVRDIHKKLDILLGLLQNANSERDLS